VLIFIILDIKKGMIISNVQTIKQKIRNFLNFFISYPFIYIIYFITEFISFVFSSRIFNFNCGLLPIGTSVFTVILSPEPTYPTGTMFV
jgi:hypothetical protein